jgi:hypothetical protein
MARFMSVYVVEYIALGPCEWLRPSESPHPVKPYSESLLRPRIATRVPGPYILKAVPEDVNPICTEARASGNPSRFHCRGSSWPAYIHRTGQVGSAYRGGGDFDNRIAWMSDLWVRNSVHVASAVPNECLQPVPPDWIPKTTALTEERFQ